MAVTDSIKDALGLGLAHDASGCEFLPTHGAIEFKLINAVSSTAADRQAMSDARLPLAYRDSCAHLLIPLNKCRHDEMYLPWKCEVWITHDLK